MCFITSWLVLAFGKPFSYTPWGIASACFWVPSGVAAIAGIKMAGLAVAMGTLSSFIVLVSFTWGIFVFNEEIHSRELACFAVFLMMVGLCGMSYYSAPENLTFSEQSTTDPIRENREHEYQLLLEDEEEVKPPEENDNNQAENSQPVEDNDSEDEGDSINDPLLVTTANSSTEAEEASEDVAPTRNFIPSPSDHILIYGIKFRRRHVGIACSVFSGTWGGSIMAPEKLAKANTSGTGYLISFAIGAAIVTIALWIMRFVYHWSRLGSASDAFQALPSFHIRVMWLPGCTAGALWSIGNFFSLISVMYLGEGVGYSVTQSAMLVSGLWGIFYFKEVTGYEAITKWFMSALLTISGILLLSYEHHKK